MKIILTYIEKERVNITITKRINLSKDSLKDPSRYTRNFQAESMLPQKTMTKHLKTILPF